MEQIAPPTGPSEITFYAIAAIVLVTAAAIVWVNYRRQR